eukprot:scaffold10043_cov35-Prasinocladus_malaysianus.AAC.1
MALPHILHDAAPSIGDFNDNNAFQGVCTNLEVRSRGGSAPTNLEASGSQRSSAQRGAVVLNVASPAIEQRSNWWFI